ncbi:MAG TPA: transposase [Candidatus Kapabacteria bacterium]|nr:transposase [Candidatus Kapabacteria bacterium]
MSTSRHDKPKAKRRRHTPDFRLSVLKECEAPGISIAEVARKHQLNANLVHKWRRDLQRSQAPQQDDFVALPVLATPAIQIGTSSNIKVELLSPAGPIVLHWPLSEASQLALWLRQL